MVVAINGRLPVGYFFANGFNRDQKAALVKQCLGLLEECGISIAIVTFDGCPANLSMSSKLGCILKTANLKTSFNEDNVNILPDPSHLCKPVRNAFVEKRKFIDVCNEIVDFRY